MRTIAFHQEAFEQYTEWAKSNRKIFDRLHRLIVEAAKNPFDGIETRTVESKLKRLLVTPHQ